VDNGQRAAMPANGCGENGAVPGLALERGPWGRGQLGLSGLGEFQRKIIEMNQKILKKMLLKKRKFSKK